MIRTLHSLLFWLSTLGGIWIMGMSIGWILGLFGIALIPFLALHIVSGARGLNRSPLMNSWLLGTSFTFFLFAVFRPDMNDVHQFTGLSVMLNNVGLRADRNVPTTEYYFYLAISLLIVTMIIDTIILMQSRRKAPVSDANEFV